jgi:hypothetical protein
MRTSALKRENALNWLILPAIFYNPPELAQSIPLVAQMSHDCLFSVMLGVLY